MTIAQEASHSGETAAALEFGRQASGLETEVVTSCPPDGCPADGDSRMGGHHAVKPEEGRPSPWIL